MLVHYLPKTSVKIVMDLSGKNNENKAHQNGCVFLGWDEHLITAIMAFMHVDVGGASVVVQAFAIVHRYDGAVDHIPHLIISVALESHCILRIVLGPFWFTECTDQLRQTTPSKLLPLWQLCAYTLPLVGWWSRPQILTNLWSLPHLESNNHCALG